MAAFTLPYFGVSTTYNEVERLKHGKHCLIQDLTEGPLKPYVNESRPAATLKRPPVAEKGPMLGNKISAIKVINALQKATKSCSHPIIWTMRCFQVPSHKWYQGNGVMVPIGTTYLVNWHTCRQRQLHAFHGLVPPTNDLCLTMLIYRAHA